MDVQENPESGRILSAFKVYEHQEKLKLCQKKKNIGRCKNEKL